MLKTTGVPILFLDSMKFINDYTRWLVMYFTLWIYEKCFLHYYKLL